MESLLYVEPGRKAAAICQQIRSSSPQGPRNFMRPAKRPAKRPVYFGGLMYTKRRAGRCNLIAPYARKHDTARKISDPSV